VSKPFIIFPAIDLKAGRVVRLQQGRANAETVYGDDPAAVARRWESEGGRFLHVVDLDGAFDGVPRNWDSVKLILGAVKIPVELGGGLRTREQIAGALALGVNRVVIGTKACESPEFVAALVSEFGGRIVVGIDARDGFVVVKGWVEKSQWPAIEFAQKIDGLGVANIIFTDVSTDGMLAGPNYAAVTAVCSAVKCNVIASGGVSQDGDVRQLLELAESHPNLAGVIVGKALYDGRIDLKHIVGCGGS
jgi:phosphoribosylformimino-5-aminoimidazole carboxamide ribotide isomerase